MQSDNRLKIGEVAKASDVAVGALRYYESLGLIQSERGENGYRYYLESAVGQVLLIKKAQSLGFTLEDIAEVMTLHQAGDRPCDFVRSRLQAKIDQLEQQIQDMTAFKDRLEDYRDRWNQADSIPRPTEICPLIESVPLDTPL